MAKMISFSPLSEGQKTFCQALGEIVVRWNNAEALFRLMLYGAIDPPRPGHRIDILTSNLSNVSLAEAVTAVAETYEGQVREHLEHCSKLFDRNRIYRNTIVHDGMMLMDDSEGVTTTLTQSVTAKGGKLRLHQGQMTLEDLKSARDQIFTLTVYIQDILAVFWPAHGDPTLASLEKPALPVVPKKQYLSPIELRRQHEASRA